MKTAEDGIETDLLFNIGYRLLILDISAPEGNTPTITDDMYLNLLYTHRME